MLPTMHHSTELQRPIRVGVFSNPEDAQQAVQQLLQAGFTREQLTVICSDRTVQRHFEAFHHQDPAGKHTPAAAVAGGTIGAILGGTTALALGAATGGVTLLAAGGLALGAGGVVGSLIGAMMTRGMEKELANYYDQAVSQGRILVAAEAQGDKTRASLDRAEAILADAGAQPIPLEEG
jgi:hypothetical protein